MALSAELCSLGSSTDNEPQSPPVECFQYQQVNLDLTCAEGDELNVDELDVIVIGPNDKTYQRNEISLQKNRTINGAVLSIIPLDIGLHKVRILCQGKEVPSSPIALNVLLPPAASSKPVTSSQHTFSSSPQSMDFYSEPDIGHVSFSGLTEPCSVGSIVEVVINAHGDSSNGSVLVEAISPSGRVKQCPVLQKANSFTATFTPNEVGEWRIGILYDDEHIRGSPFSCNVYDANVVQVYGLDVGLVGQEIKFSVNAAQAGQGFVKVRFRFLKLL
ncbi:unnamed protein product [Anisakis simplex]|uniref:Filamin/ABP280 repeat protein n=1 Tax=Anisakis simplex TaxID=6269 RepID=A0A0M3K4Z5_ANISI|nr:unnamed protein product [Anisakis simplex]